MIPINSSKSLNSSDSNSSHLPDYDLRCYCGRLIAKQTAKGIEIRCPRCKRTWTFVKKLGASHAYENESFSEQTKESLHGKI